MAFELLFTERAACQLDALESDDGLAKRLKAVRKALGMLGVNLRHPGPNTHKFFSINGPGGEEVFEAYAENKIPAAWRILWMYGPDRNQITIVTITPHP